MVSEAEFKEAVKALPDRNTRLAVLYLLDILQNRQVSDFELESRLKAVVDKEVTAGIEHLSEAFVRQRKILLKQRDNIDAQQRLIVAHLKAIDDARDKTLQLVIAILNELVPDEATRDKIVREADAKVIPVPHITASTPGAKPESTVEGREP